MITFRPPLRQTLETLLEPRLTKRYLRAAQNAEGLPARYFYNTALRDLSIKDSENCIYHLILALDVDPEFTPAQHLGKTMLFGLSKKYAEEGGLQHRQMYPNTVKRLKDLEDSIKERERSIDKLRNDALAEKMQVANVGFFGRLFGGGNRQRLLKLEAMLRAEIETLQEEKKARNQSAKYAQIEEFTRVLGLVLEICLYPSRFARVGETPARSTVKMNLQDRFWVG